MKIETRHNFPPIPDRSHDWSAWDDDTYEPGCPVGHGATEAEAVADLAAKMRETECVCCGGWRGDSIHRELCVECAS